MVGSRCHCRRPCGCWRVTSSTDSPYLSYLICTQVTPWPESGVRCLVAAAVVTAYAVRKRFQKLYYHFRPDTFFWMFSIIVRKFGIAFTALMFRKNAVFQMAFALLIMFAAYVLQVCVYVSHNVTR